MIAALFVERDGAYYGLPDVDPWGGYSHNDRTEIDRDARDYRGPHPVVAHPPCERWGRFARGSTRKPNQYRPGEDGGCFAAALTAVRNYGGVLEHPKDSLAWDFFGIQRPSGEGWQRADAYGGWTCCVEQGHYGHKANKPTWLYAVAPADALPSLTWRKGEQRLHPKALADYGYAKARRIGMMAMEGGKDKKRNRNHSPRAFADVLLSIARAVHTQRSAQTDGAHT